MTYRRPRHFAVASCPLDWHYIQGSSHDHTNLIGSLVFMLHFPGIYLMKSLHYFYDGYTAIRYLTMVISVGVVQWFLLCLCYLLLSKKIERKNAS